MDSLLVVRNELLNRKINEHWKRKPKSKSAIFEIKFGNVRTIWKVNRAKNGFSVTEINASKANFFMEAGTVTAGPPAPAPGSASPYSSSQIDIDPETRSAMQPAVSALGESPINPDSPFSQEYARTGDFMKAAQKLSQGAFNIAFSQWRITSPNQITQDIQNQALQQWSQQNPVIAHKLGIRQAVPTAQQRPTVMMPRDPNLPKTSVSRPAAIKSHKSVSGKMLREQGEEDQQQTQVPQEEPPGQAGLETNPEPAIDTQTQQQDQPSVVRPEDRVAGDFQGRTIVSANLAIEQDGSLLTMQMTGVDNPVTMKFKRDGIIVYSFRGRTSIFRPSGEPTNRDKKSSKEKKKGENEK